MSQLRNHQKTTNLEGKFSVNLQSNIGSGTYGSVYTCKSKSGETFAVKKLLHRLPNKEDCSGDEKENVERIVAELSTLKGLDHPNIAKLIDLFEGVQRDDWLVTEYCEHGDLNKYLATETPDRSRKLNLMLQCSRAVEYLHGVTPPLVHRDIKPGNVLLKSENGELWVKLTDLGLAKIYDNHPGPVVKDYLKDKWIVGSCYFMAPEIFEESDAWIYKEPVDIFALGLLFLVLHRHVGERLDGDRQILPVSIQNLDKDIITDSTPFYGDNLFIAMQGQTEHPQLFIDDDTGPLQELIVKMTDCYPETRPKATEIVKKLQNIIDIELRGCLHAGGARPKINYKTKSHVITPRVDNTKVEKNKEAMDSLTEAYNAKYKIRMVTPHNTRGKYDRRQYCKNILLIGETGSGKTTLVDGIYNYIRQVKWDEPNRYCITEPSQHHEVKRDSTQSQTDWITVYAIPNCRVSDEEFTINVVDTPGLADTRGIEYDESFKERLHKFFEKSKGHGILTIDAVCYVWSASENKLTAARRKIIKSVKSLFAIDIEKNIVCLACFADEFKPQVYDLVPIPQQNKFKFNNGILFKGRGLQSTWEWTMESYHQFFNYLSNVEPVSTRLTVKMLQEKILLQQNISIFKDKVQKHCERVQEDRNIVQQLNQETDEEIKNQTIKTTKRYKVEHKNDRHRISLQCKQCDETTCHYPCTKWDVTVFKYLFCERFGWSGKCKICGHKASDHFKERTMHYVEFKVNIKKSVAELMEQYMVKTKEGLVKRLEEPSIMIILADEMDKIYKLNNKLHKIALYMPTKETIGEIIDDFIEEEHREKNESYEERVMIYKECKQKIAKKKKAMSNLHRNKSAPARLVSKIMK